MSNALTFIILAGILALFWWVDPACVVLWFLGLVPAASVGDWRKRWQVVLIWPVTSVAALIAGFGGKADG